VNSSECPQCGCLVFNPPANDGAGDGSNVVVDAERAAADAAKIKGLEDQLKDLQVR